MIVNFWFHQAVVKAMELLALEGKIKEKTYGKQKIYFADQVSLFICVTRLNVTCTNVSLSRVMCVWAETFCRPSLQAQFTDVSETDLKGMDSQISELGAEAQSLTQSCKQLDAGGVHSASWCLKVERAACFLRVISGP